jgi:CelD/BcsL family acetyltransferase involved in cellulose biosynthesis
MDGIRSAWESLYREGKHTLFQSFDWNKSSAQIFAEREEHFVIFAECARGAAILPGAITRNNVTLLSEELFDYRDILAVGDDEASSLAWKTLGEVSHTPDTEFRVKGVCESSLVRGFQNNPKSGAKIFMSEFFANAPSVRCKEALSRQKHPRLERNFERLKADGCEMKIATASDGRLITEILSLKAKQDANSLFHDLLRIEVLCQMAALAGNRCEIFALTNGSTIVAALITFIDGEWRRLYTTYYDARWGKSSPGVSLVNHVIGLSIEVGMNVDLMTGEQPYKQRFATSKEALFTLCASAAALRGMSTAREVPIAA